MKTFEYLMRHHKVTIVIVVMIAIIGMIGFLTSCTKIEYITEIGNDTVIRIDSIELGNKRPVIPSKPYILHDIDDNIYDSVILGTQIWMTKNLKTTRYTNGLSITNITDKTEWSNAVTPAMCWYGDGNALYNYYAVNTNKLCPIGWHVPDDGEWKTLEGLIGMNTIEIDSLGWRGDSDAIILESSNFKALFTGFRSGWNGSYGDYNQGAYYWTSSRYDEFMAYFRSLSYSISKIYRQANSKASGFSVRCIKD